MICYSQGSVTTLPFSLCNHHGGEPYYETIDVEALIGDKEFKIVDDIDISKEELDYFENHDFGEEMREALENGTAIVSEGNWDETVKAMKAKMAANATKAITIRVPVRVIERYKKRAAAAGIGYQTLMKQMLEAAPV